MTPNIPLPTDSLHKFLCLLGVALLLSSFVGFFVLYTTTLDKKVSLSEEISQLEANQQRTKIEQDRLALRKRVLEVTTSNEQFFSWAVAAFCCGGVFLIAYGGRQWHKKGQLLDDEMKELQTRKLRIEVAAMEKSNTGNPPAH